MIAGLLSGSLVLLASPSLGIWPLILVAYLPLLISLERRFHGGRLRWRDAVAAGYLLGLMHAGSLFFWLLTVNPWSLIPVVGLYALLHAALAVAILSGLRCGLRGGWLSAWTLCFWLASEALVSDRFFELPAYGLGYFLWEAPALIQLAELGGAHAVSLLVMALNLMLARLWLDGPRRALPWLAGTASLVLAAGLYGAIRLQDFTTPVTADSSLRVLSLHTRVKPEQKRDREAIRAMFDRFADITRAAASAAVPPDLILWPETSVPVWLRSPKERDLIQGLLAIAADASAPLVIGAHSVRATDSGATAVYNAAFLVPPAGYIAQEYHKVLLAPGVEKTPLASLLPATLGRRWPSRLTPGTEPTLIHPRPDTALAAFICWEALFPHHVRELVLLGGSVLINLSNDEAAFGTLRAAYAIPLPHLAFRAVENRRWLVRSANAGPALVVGPDGRIQAQSALFAEGALDAEVARTATLTVFTRFGHHIAPALIWVALLWGCWLPVNRRRRRASLPAVTVD